MSTVNDLFEQAMKLSPAEREELANRLWQSALPEVPGEEISQEEWDKVWGEEIARRAEQVERGEVVPRDWSEVMAEMRAKYKPRDEP